MPETDRPTTVNEACDHPVATHYHGTLACYNLDLCRCDDCRGANRRYEKLRSSWVGEFPKVQPPLVDAAPVVEHVTRLMDQGMGMKRIGEVAGVSPSVIGNVVYGRGGSEARAAERLRRETAEKVLAVELDLADGAKVPKAEAVRIVKELRARDWSKSAIAKRLGSDTFQFAKGPFVQAGTLRALRKLLLEPVPLRKHGPTGKMYDPSTDHEWQTIRETTHGVPSEWRPGSPVWLAEMRRGLWQAVREARERNRHRSLDLASTVGGDRRPASEVFG